MTGSILARESLMKFNSHSKSPSIDFSQEVEEIHEFSKEASSSKKSQSVKSARAAAKEPLKDSIQKMSAEFERQLKLITDQSRQALKAKCLNEIYVELKPKRKKLPKVVERLEQRRVICDSKVRLPAKALESRAEGEKRT